MCFHSFLMVFLLILNLNKSRFSTIDAFEIEIFDGYDCEKYGDLQVLMLFWSTSRQRLKKVNVCDLASSLNLSASILVTKVKPDPLSRSALTFTETSPFDT